MTFLLAFFITFIACIVLVPVLTGLGKFFCLYAIVQECEAHVFLLFGRVIGVIDEPGLHLLALKIGPHALLIRFFGAVRRVDLRLDQEYLRSEPVNSEEGTPMGIGVWYEMRVGNPADYLFRNTDPRGSLRANVRNATVRCLSNMPLQNLLEDRHKMSRRVREEVSPKSQAWGYHLGSVYVRKVHFRDDQMIHQIEQKVVNRLRQVTSAIRQQGANQVAVIKSGAERAAAAEFAHAAAVRPYLVGKAIQEIARDREILNTVFEILETEKMLEGDVELTLVPRDSLFARLLAANGASRTTRFRATVENRCLSRYGGIVMQSAARHIVRRLREAGHQALFAGGCVRDALMGKTPHDFDIATSARPEQVQALFPRTVPVGVQFGVVLVIENGQEYQVATFRSDGNYLDGRHPQSVTFSSAEEDARRRDFTVNGLFYDPIDEKVLDFVGGRQDLETRTLRAIGVAGQALRRRQTTPPARRSLCRRARLHDRDGNLDGHPRRGAGHSRRQRRTPPRRTRKNLHVTATRARLRFAGRQRSDGRDPARDGSSQRLRTTARLSSRG